MLGHSKLLGCLVFSILLTSAPLAQGQGQAPGPSPVPRPVTAAPTATASPAQAAQAPVAGAAAAQPAGAAAALKPDPRRMDAILEAWSKQSKTVQTLYARFTREDVVQAWQDKTRYDGTAYLKSPNLAYLNFEKFGEDGKSKPYERIVCNGSQVYHFLADNKQVHIYTLAEQERQRALEEGPLPFLFNMDADRARLRYQMTLLQENEELFLIAITPIQQVDREAFSRAYIYLDKKRFMPTQIRLIDPSNGKDSKTFSIVVVQPNIKVPDAYYDSSSQTRDVVQSAKWDVVEYGSDGKPVNGGRAAAGPPAQGAPARQPSAAAAAPAARTGPVPKR